MNNSKQAFVESEGDLVFERLLRDYGFRFRRHLAVGSKHPDFLVKSKTGLVLCEVRDLIESDFDKAILKDKVDLFQQYSLEGSSEFKIRLKRESQRLQNIKGNSVGNVNPFRRIKRIIDKKRDQMAGLKGRVPCVLVLNNLGSFPHDCDLIMRHALESHKYFGPTFNTTISAIAIIDILYPNRTEIEQKIHLRHEELAGDRPYGGVKDKEFMIELLPKLRKYEEELLTKLPAGYLATELVRLRIYHNKDAAMLLPPNTFPGEHNLEIHLDTIIDEANTSMFRTFPSNQVGEPVGEQCLHCYKRNGLQLQEVDSSHGDWRCRFCQGITRVERLSDGRIRISAWSHEMTGFSNS